MHTWLETERDPTLASVVREAGGSGRLAEIGVPSVAIVVVGE